MRRIFLSFVFMGFGLFFIAPTASATSLQITPALYKNIEIKKGEKAKAYVDIANSSANKQEIQLSVKRFKQIDNNGTLSFFDDEAVTSGVALDLNNFELNPRDSIRVYFLLDSTKLPAGDVFVAIFAKTVPEEGMVAQGVQVGTLLSITNGTPSSRTAEISAISAPLVQWGDGISASIIVNNPAPEASATGFFPELNVSLQPYTKRTVDGPLIFAGRSRSIDYTQKGNYFGIIRMLVKTNGDEKSRWIFAITGFWQWLAPLIVTILATAILLWRSMRRKPRRK